MLVGWIAVLPQHTTHHRPELGPHGLFHSPVNGDVSPYRLNEFSRNHAERFVSEDLYGTVIDLQGIVEGEFLLGQPKLVDDFINGLKEVASSAKTAPFAFLQLAPLAYYILEESRDPAAERGPTIPRMIFPPGFTPPTGAPGSEPKAQHAAAEPAIPDLGGTSTLLDDPTLREIDPMEEA